MISSLQNWAARCTSTLGDLEAQVNEIRAAAAVRVNQQRASDEKLKALLVAETHEMEKKQDISGSTRDLLLRRAYQKRAMGEAGSAPSDESMDLDEQHGVEDALKRASKRKM